MIRVLIYNLTALIWAIGSAITHNTSFFKEELQSFSRIFDGGPDSIQTQMGVELLHRSEKRWLFRVYLMVDWAGFEPANEWR
jgi:hypothetical protein